MRAGTLKMPLSSLSVSYHVDLEDFVFVMSPFLQAAVIEQFEIVFDYKGYNSVSQAFFKKSQAAYSAVVILEGMNAFKAYMKIQQIPQFFF